MAIRYHVNPKTGRPNLCNAKTPDKCLYYDADTNTEAPHFNTKTEARAHIEKEMVKEYGTQNNTLSKKTDKLSDLESSINKIELELSGLRELKKTATPEEIRKINGVIRGKSIHLSRKKGQLEQEKKNNVNNSVSKVSKNSEIPKDIQYAAGVGVLTGKDKVSNDPNVINKYNDLLPDKHKQSNPNKENVLRGLKNALNETNKPVPAKPKFEEPTVIETEGYMGNKGWIGSKLSATNKYMSTKEVSQNIRNDIKQAEAAGYLPKGYKYSVRSGAGNSNSVNVEIMGMPEDKDKYDYVIHQTGLAHNPYRVVPQLKPEYQEVVDKVKAIHNSYNYDNSNAMVDYFSRGYYGNVTVPDDNKLAWNKMEANNRKVKRVISELKKNGLDNDSIKKDKNFINAKNKYDESVKNYRFKNAVSNIFYEETRKSGVIDWNKIENQARQQIASNEK